MTFQHDSRTEHALAFLDLCKVESDLSKIIADFHRTIETYGFPHCACGAWAGIGKQRQHRFFFNSWPQAWMDIYTKDNIFAEDPLVYESFRRISAFTWSEARLQRKFSRRGREIDQVVRDFGWKEIVAVPVHGPADYQGLVSLATLSPVQLTLRDLAMLQAVGLAVHDRCRMQTDFGMEALPAPLTPREVECLQWAAVGKTDWEIGQLLEVSAATAHYHIERAKAKLGVSSRVQAVALAVLRGLI